MSPNAAAEEVDSDFLNSGTAQVTDQWEISPEYSGADENRSAVTKEGGQIGPFVMVADNPHFSQGDVSAHGCYTGGPAGGQAVVRNWIEQKTSDGKWKLVATGSPVIVPEGCGRGKRSNARADCRNFNRTLYRNVVDVDIAGAVDSPLKAYKENWVNCGV